MYGESGGCMLLVVDKGKQQSLDSVVQCCASPWMLVLAVVDLSSVDLLVFGTNRLLFHY